MPVTLGQSDVLGGDEIEELLHIQALFVQVSQMRGFQHAQASTIIKTSINILSYNFFPQSVMDVVTPEEVLQKFTSLLLSIPLEQPFEFTNEFDRQLSSHHDISPYNTLLLALRNAQLWELQNMQSALLTFALRQTNPLSSLSPPSASTGNSSPNKFKLIHASETSPAELVKRAISGDIAICLVLWGVNDGREVDSPQLVDGGCAMDMDKESSSKVQTFRGLCVHHLMIFHAFLYHMGQFMNGLDYTPPSTLALSSDACTRETLNLVSFQLLEHGNCSLATVIVSTLKTLYEYFVPILLEGEEPETNDTFMLSNNRQGCAHRHQVGKYGYVKCTAKLLTTVCNALNVQVIKATRELSIDHFAHLLSVIAEGIEDPPLPVAGFIIAAETQKAEPLAKPFAKHVGHILLADIDSMNDLLCILTPEIQQELEPGLFSLQNAGRAWMSMGIPRWGDRKHKMEGGDCDVCAPSVSKLTLHPRQPAQVQLQAATVGVRDSNDISPDCSQLLCFSQEYCKGVQHQPGWNCKVSMTLPDHSHELPRISERIPKTIVRPQGGSCGYQAITCNSP
ncbi:hypothetical protein EDC04DRAFT_2613298 [Pisolithus marmoratus]|nr:hypothetical protein EDC04DRAFT_2613298 [Pisolithus marmoratus]